MPHASSAGKTAGMRGVVQEKTLLLYSLHTGNHCERARDRTAAKGRGSLRSTTAFPTAITSTTMGCSGRVVDPAVAFAVATDHSTAAAATTCVTDTTAAAAFAATTAPTDAGATTTTTGTTTIAAAAAARKGQLPTKKNE